ncbi:hypothetical protein [Nocardia sp. 348MFTsu5.1]|uniref:hypothetical protein n=1 Tax=Nocardia sp. 348MFTsu5.1 TaxID=1172185 RepID=UPI0003667B65|nr:hypothetical protein [Nocardia sp. 348MFTsu5.1]
MGSQFEAADRPMIRRKLVLIPSAIVVVALITLGFFATWEHHSLDRTVRDAAKESQVEVPGTATEVSATYDRVRIQGGCSTLSFLMPKPQWRNYVSAHMIEILTPTTFGPSSGCEPIPHDCVDDVGADGLTGYTAGDRGGESGDARTLYVIPDCEPGKALIAWSAFDL